MSILDSYLNLCLLKVTHFALCSTLPFSSYHISVETERSGSSQVNRRPLLPQTEAKKVEARREVFTEGGGRRLGF